MSNAFERPTFDWCHKSQQLPFLHNETSQSYAIHCASSYPSVSDFPELTQRNN